MIEKMILVAAGGAAGAVCRYLVSLVPVKADFPVMTFVTNLAGAFLIGLIVGLAANRWSESPRLVLFLKTGFCGGFTTFSTFSLETVQLLEKMPNKTLKLSKNSEIHEYMRFKKIKWKIFLKLLENL